MMVESIKSITISAETMRAHFTFKNIELIKELEAKNRSIVLMCAHYGSWEWIFILQTYVSHKGYAVYKNFRILILTSFLNVLEQNTTAI